MIEDLKPYPDMKDSGVEWLGDVPLHWEVRRLKASATNVIEQTNQRPDQGITLALENVESWSGRYTDAGSDTVLESQLKQFRCGDVLFGKLRPYLAKVVCPNQSGVCVGEFLVLRQRSENVLPDFLQRTLCSKPVIDHINALTYGAKMPRAEWQVICNLEQPVPTLHEQAAIVRFLDYTDRRIRRYIRAKQKLIALLEEQKQAIIHQAVTGQIDVRTGQPYPAYKPSGVEWLRDVPAHWKVLPLKRTFTAIDYGISDTGTDDGTIAVLTMGNIREGAVTVPDHGGVTSVAPELLLQDKDLLFNRTNSAELVAKVGLFRSRERPITFASYLVRLRTRQGNRPEFLNLLLNDAGFLASARREAIPSLHQSNLNPTRYGRLLSPLPPTREQEAIVDFVEENTSDLKAANSRANRQIELLHEFHTRLIADVVTGKLDVGEAAPDLPVVDPLAAEDGPDDTFAADDSEFNIEDEPLETAD